MSPSAFHHHEHEDCTAPVLDQAERRASQAGVRLTPVRRRTLEILLEEHRAMGAYEALDRLAEEGFGRQPPVVYRALEFLVEQGLAHRVQRLNAFAACMHPAEDHEPAFLICEVCRRIAEAPAEAVRAALAATAADFGFELAGMSLEATGRCPDCRGGQDAA